MRCDVIIHTAALPHLEVGEKRIHTTVMLLAALPIRTTLKITVTKVGPSSTT